MKTWLQNVKKYQYKASSSSQKIIHDDKSIICKVIVGKLVIELMIAVINWTKENMLS